MRNTLIFLNFFASLIFVVYSNPDEDKPLIKKEIPFEAIREVKNTMKNHLVDRLTRSDRLKELEAIHDDDIDDINDNNDNDGDEAININTDEEIQEEMIYQPGYVARLRNENLQY